jgi:hypothetical protein
MESDRVLAVALESPVHLVRVLVPASAAPPGGHGDPHDPCAPAPPDEAEGLLAYASAQLPDGDHLVQCIALPDGAGETWLAPEAWGPGARVEVDRRSALVSLVGEGAVTGGTLIREARACLEAESIPIRAVHTSSLSVSLVVPEGSGEAATRALHRRFLEPGREAG